MKSWAEISAAKLRANYAAIRRAAGDRVEVMAVIKANAYGHDAVLCGRVLAAAGARWLGVADVEEAVRLRADPEAGGTRLLLMSGIEAADATAVRANKLTPVVWTAAQIEALEEGADEAQEPLAVHLEIDTGMARQGVAPGAALGAVLARLATSRSVTLEGVMTHLAAAEVARGAFTQTQQQRFEAAIEQIRAAGERPQYVHVANSSGVDEGSTLPWLRRTAARIGAQAMVRAGLSLYGYVLPIGDRHDEQGEQTLREGLLGGQLQPVLTWKTRLLDLREIGAGSTVGYGGTFRAAQAMRIALLPIGYADGFRRAASSGLQLDWRRGWVMIRGQRAYVVGRVSMNLTAVDVSAIDGVRLSDEVVLLGEGVTAEDHAGWSETISYEILCGLRAPVQLV